MRVNNRNKQIKKEKVTVNQTNEEIKTTIKNQVNKDEYKKPNNKSKVL